jgi:peroxiredoxin
MHESSGMMVSEASRNPSRPWWALGIALVLIALSLLVRRPWQERAATDGYGLVDQPVSESGAGSLPVEPAPGKLAPNFRLRTSDGEEIVLADLRGRPVLVNFWATWCLFCVTEMPALDEFARRHQGRVTVIGINVGEPPETVEAFARQVGVHYPLLLDSTREVTRAYRVRSMPMSLLIDAQGVVQSVRYGVLTPPEMEERLAPLLTPAAGGAKVGG